MSDRVSRWSSYGLVAGLQVIGACFRSAAPRGDDADAVLQPASAAPFVQGTKMRFAVDIVVKETGARQEYEHLVLDDVVTVKHAGRHYIETEEYVERAFGESDSASGWRNLEGMRVESRFDRHGHLLTRSLTEDTGRRHRMNDLEDAPLTMPLFRSSYAPPIPMRVGGAWALERVGTQSGLDPQWMQTTYQLTQLGWCQITQRCATISMQGHAESRPGDRHFGSAVQFRGEYTIDARDLHLLRSWGERIETWRDGRRKTTRVTVERRTEPSKRPPGMSTGVATLRVIAIPWAQVEIDGKEPWELATTPVEVKLPTGRHVVRLHNDHAQRDETIEVMLEDARAVTIYRNWCKGTPSATLDTCRTFDSWD